MNDFIDVCTKLGLTIKKINKIKTIASIKINDECYIRIADCTVVYDNILIYGVGFDFIKTFDNFDEFIKHLILVISILNIFNKDNEYVKLFYKKFNAGIKMLNMEKDFE